MTRVAAGSIGLTVVGKEMGFFRGLWRGIRGRSLSELRSAAGSLIARAIARRQDLPYSHAVISLGRDRVADQPWKHFRIRPLDEWLEERVVHWWAPVTPWTAEERRILERIAEAMEGRVTYSWRSIGSLLLRGRGSAKRTHGLYCSEAVAEIYLAVRNHDFSGNGQTHNVDLRMLMRNLGDPRDFRFIGQLDP